MKRSTLFIALSLPLLFGSCGIPSPPLSVTLPFPETREMHPAHWSIQILLGSGTLFEGLFGYTPEKAGLGGIKVKPLIAESWKNSPDGRTWIFKLHKGKKWSNGDPVTAHDFEWTFRHICGPDNPDMPLWASALGSLSNAWNVRSGVAPIETLGVRALDATTLKIVLEQGDYNLPLGLATAGTVPLHRKTVEAHPGDWEKPEYFVGNGPFRLAEWTPTRRVLSNNPFYAGVRGNVREIILVSEGSLDDFKAGRLDAAWITTEEDYRTASALPGFRAVFKEEILDLSFGGYEINRGHGAVLDDLRIRQAFASAIDREALIREALGRWAEPAYSVWPKKSLIGKKIKEIPYDPERAKRLLSEAGYPGGHGLPELVFHVPLAGDPVADLLVREWERILGVRVRIKPLDPETFDTVVWHESPGTPPGFSSFSGSMNYFNPGSLVKAMEHTILFFNYPAETRKALWDYEAILKPQIRISSKGRIRQDWEDLARQRKDILSRADRIQKTEKHKTWKKILASPEIIRRRHETLFSRWEAAATSEEKAALWRIEAEALIEDEKEIYAYESRSPGHKAMHRAYQDLRDMSWDKALVSAHKVLQMFQDEAYIVPLYHRKTGYVRNPKLTGLMVYKFAWGPQFFNFRHLNLLR